MTVSSSTNRVSYSGNGSLTAFAYTFKVFDEDDLTVILRASDGTETVQTITTNYTVSGVGDAGGGNVTFTTAPASGVTVVILREQPLTQGLDLVPNDPFPAQSLEDQLDKLTFITQQHSEELGRAIKASKTNVITGAEFTISASDRANKVFAFDSSGDVSITSELGVYRGNWAAGVAYNQRDLVKDSSNDNIYLANTAHTSSGSTPLSSNADIAKWDLIVNAAAAASSASAAATSATAAQTAQTAAESAQTAAETAQTAAETAETNAETAQTAAETAQTAAETAQSAAETAYDNFDDRYLGAKASDPTLDNDGDVLIDGALYFDTTNNVMKVYDLGGTAWNRTTPTSAEQTNIDTVSGISANVTTVAGISSNVTTVAGISSDVTTVAADGTDIGTVAGISANVTTVAGIDSDVTTVAGISSDVTTVSGISANVTTVAGVSGNVTTVAGVSADVTTVAGISANVTTVATNDANVTTVASNIAGVNSFAERYRVGSSDPTTSLDEGDLAYNTTSNVLKYYNGTSWQSISPGIGSVADDSSPQLGGNLDLNSNNITGTGDITTIGTLGIGTTSDTLYYNSTNTYNVTASIKTNTANEVSELALINGNNNFGSAIDFARTNSAGNDVRFATINALPTNNTAGTEAGALRFYTKDTTDSNVAERMRIGQDGNVGVGTTSPSTGKLVINSTQTGTEKQLAIRDSTNGWTRKIGLDTSNNLGFFDGDTERMRIDSNGYVGIGTSSPHLYYASQLVVDAPDEGGITIVGDTTEQNYIMFADGSSGGDRYRGYIGYDHNIDAMQLTSGGIHKFLVNDTTEAMRIDTNGVVTFDNGISEEYTAVTSSSNATTVNLRDGTNFSHTLTENTTFTFSNPASSGKVSSFTLKLVQDASASGYTVTWPSSVDWPAATAPTLTATASAVDYFVFITHDGGTTWYGFTAGQALG